MSTQQSQGPSKAERLTSLIYALATRPRKLTTADIGAYLVPDGSAAAREKAVERFRDEIRNDFGLRLISDDIDGVHYHRLDTDEWYLPEIEFTPAEAGLIALAASLWKDSRLQALGLKAAARVTGGTADLEQLAPFAGSLLPRLSLDEPNFHDCALAVFNRRTVKFRYATARGEQSERLLDVWGIGQRFGNWYFTGFDHSRGAQRVFRLSRVQSKFTTFTHKANGATSYQPRPENFSMSQVLLDFDLRNPAQAAVLQLRGDAATPLRARAIAPSDTDRLNIGYADRDSFAAELAAYGPAVKVLEPADLAAAVHERLSQAAQAQDRIAAEVDPGAVSFRPRRGGGRRGTTAAQVMRNIDMIQYVVSHGVVTVKELAERYDMDQEKVRSELAMIMMCGVPNGQHDELINVNDGDLDADTVTISNAALLAAPQKLAPLEAVAVLGGLNALASVPGFEHGEVLRSAQAKVNSAVARFDGWNGALGFALSQVREHDIPARLVEALRARQVLDLDYYSAHAQSHGRRLVEPVRLIEDGPVQYLRAWCRTRQDLLTFRVDRILEADPTGEHFELADRHHDDSELDVRYRGSEDDVLATVYVTDESLPAIEAFQPSAWSTSKVAGGQLAQVRFSYDLVPAPLVGSHGGKIAVVSPDATRQRVRDWLTDALSMYEE